MMALPRLQGNRISLRQLRRSDTADIRKNANHKEVARFVPRLPSPYGLKEARSWIEKTYRLSRKKAEYHFGIADSDDRIIGMIGLRAVDFHSGNAEVGFWLGKRYWSKGFTTEAVKLVMDFAFSQLKLARLYAVVMELNKGSIRVLEKNGFIREGTWRKAHLIGRRRYDVYAYGILRSEHGSR